MHEKPSMGTRSTSHNKSVSTCTWLSSTVTLKHETFLTPTSEGSPLHGSTRLGHLLSTRSTSGLHWEVDVYSIWKDSKQLPRVNLRDHAFRHLTRKPQPLSIISRYRQVLHSLHSRSPWTKLTKILFAS